MPGGDPRSSAFVLSACQCDPIAPVRRMRCHPGRGARGRSAMIGPHDPRHAEDLRIPSSFGTAPGTYRQWRCQRMHPLLREDLPCLDRGGLLVLTQCRLVSSICRIIMASVRCRMNVLKRSYRCRARSEWSARCAATRACHRRSMGGIVTGPARYGSVGRLAAVEEEFLAEGNLLGRLRIVRRDRLSDQLGREANLVERFGLGQWTRFGNGTRFAGSWPLRFAQAQFLFPDVPVRPQPPAVKPSLDQAAGRKRVALDIGTALVSRGNPNVFQTSLSAFASPSISASWWNGVGVMRSRSVPRGTVG